VLNGVWIHYTLDLGDATALYLDAEARAGVEGRERRVRWAFWDNSLPNLFFIQWTNTDLNWPLESSDHEALGHLGCREIQDPETCVGTVAPAIDSPKREKTTPSPLFRC